MGRKAMRYLGKCPQEDQVAHRQPAFMVDKGRKGGPESNQGNRQVPHGKSSLSCQRSPEKRIHLGDVE